MKAVTQNFQTGKLGVSEIPPPVLRRRGILVRTAASLISPGTERAILELSRKGLLGKARSRPDLVRQVLNKARQDGWIETFLAVRNLMSVPIPLGYSCAGVVEAVGEAVAEFQVGERVACAGLGFANHAEVVSVPRNLVVRVPDQVESWEAAFVTLGAIALHGLRLAGVTLGDRVVVIGLGLVGQLTVQLARGFGCRVFGLDLDPRRARIAAASGAHAAAVATEMDIPLRVREFTEGRGVDAVLICAAAKDSAAVELAGEIARDRGTVVAVGDVGLEVPRRLYYEKELQLRVARSYGPGRYDPNYEERGHDYPFGYVRWTENRNMAAFLECVADGRVRLGSLVTHRFQIDDAEQAYALVRGASREFSLAILLTYDPERPVSPRVTLLAPRRPAPRDGVVRIGLVGAGTFARGILIPRLARIPGVQIWGVMTGSGFTARAVAERYGARYCTGEAAELLADPETDAIIIATRHAEHAALVTAALRKGKHVFVEKPLALGWAELQGVREAAETSNRILMVGYNRRFSPLVVAARDFFADRREPMVIQYRVNAGRLPASHWAQDEVEGGGRIVGEVCHFVDFCQFLIGTDPVCVQAVGISGEAGATGGADTLVMILQFQDGSVGQVSYLANGDPSVPKERIEMFAGGGVAAIENFRVLERWRGGRHTRLRFWRQQKGHTEEMRSFVAAVKDEGGAPIPLRSLLFTSATTFALQEAMRSGEAIPVSLEATVPDQRPVSQA